MYGEWIIAHGSATGLRHIEDGSECQDAQQVWYDESANFGIAVVSDGAGSAANAAQGSSFLVAYCTKLFSEKVKELTFPVLLGLSGEAFNTMAIELFQAAYTGLQVYADAQAIPLKSLAATVIVVIFGKSGIICSHIGDGRAGYQDAGGDWHPLLDPFKGEEANQTVFITSDIWGRPGNFIRTTVVNVPLQAFTLLSDGCETACFALRRWNEETQLYEKANIPFAKFFDPNIATLKKLAEEGWTTAQINEVWVGYLEKGNEKLASETDDKTLIVGVLKN